MTILLLVIAHSHDIACIPACEVLEELCHTSHSLCYKYSAQLELLAYSYYKRHKTVAKYYLEKMTISHAKSFRQTLKHQAKEYFENSTLHGIHYAADGSLHLIERLTWIIFCCIGMVSTAVIIVLLWEKFQTNPTITGLDTEFHDWNVPFPAVTLCVSHPHNETHVEWFIRSMNLTHSNERLEEEDNCNLLRDYNKGDIGPNPQRRSNCSSEVLIKLAGLSYSNVEAFKGLHHFASLQGYSLRNLSLEVSAHCEDIFKDCTWKGQKLNSCCYTSNPDGLWPIFTDHGFCYSFNSQKASHSWPWLGKEVKNRETLEIYETDDSWDFSFNLKDTKHFPVKIFIHDAKETPDVLFQPQHEWDGRISLLVFSAKTTYTTEEARQLSIGQRHCVFPDELQLKLDPDGYTHSGCLRECHADEAMRMCGCIPPFVDEMGYYKHCDLHGMACLARYKDLLINSESCSCELSCLNTVYEVEKLSGGVCRQNECEPLRIGFVSWPMVRYKREVLFGWVDLLVSFGGIAGLFLGFSLLSGVEIIYYFTLRVLCMTFVAPSKLKNQNITHNKRSSRIKKTMRHAPVHNAWQSQIGTRQMRRKKMPSFQSSQKLHPDQKINYTMHF